MRNLILLFLSIFISGICPAQLHTLNFHRIGEKLPSFIQEHEKRSGESFTMKFDTLSFFLVEEQSSENLINRIVVDYDSEGRVSEANLFLSGGTDTFKYVYHYQGSFARFSTMDYFQLVNSQAKFLGIQRHLYDAGGRLISSIEYDDQNNIIYGDSLSISYDDQSRINYYEYLYFELGRWKTGKKTDSIVYREDIPVSYNLTEVETGKSGKDTLVAYRYEDVAFLKDDFSFLFPDFDEWFEMDSLGVDRFFLSGEDASKDYVKSPIQFNKFKLNTSGTPGQLVMSADYITGDQILSQVSDSTGQELYSIGYRQDEEGRLTEMLTTYPATSPRVASFEYNKFGRISEYRVVSDLEDLQEILNYSVDAQGQLRVFDQKIRNESLEIRNLLKFGYRTTIDKKKLSESHLSAFPNPATAEITVRIPAGMSQEASASVFNALGEKQAVRYKEGGVGEVRIKVGHLPSGIYVIILEDRQQRVFSRFQKI